MIKVKKLGKNVVKYCTHCDKRASYTLYFTNPVIIQQGSNGSLCEQCMGLFKYEIDKATSNNKSIKVEKKLLKSLKGI